MARRSYRQRRRFRRGTKWSANLQEISTTTVTAPNNSSFWQSFVLSFNPTQVNTAVSQVFTVKNIEVSFYIDSSTSTSFSYIEDVAAYIMFVPQGMAVTENYNLQHPEYIMAYKFLGSPSSDAVNGSPPGQQYQPVKVRTRLSRKLQSGDNVILFIKGNNTYNNPDLPEQFLRFDFHGLVRWWTKAN